MNKSESYHSNAVEVDGFRFETLVPEQVVHVHKYEEETPVQLGFRITNQASTPYRFELQRFLPELSDPHGRLMKINGVNRNTSTEAEESDIPLIMPGASVEFLMTAKISWYSKDCFQLLGQAIYGGFWTFYNLKPGKYQVRFNYENILTKKQMFLYKGRTEVDSFWTANLFYQQETAVLVSFHRDICCRFPIGLLTLSIRSDNKQIPSNLPARVPAMPESLEACTHELASSRIHRNRS